MTGFAQPKHHPTESLLMAHAAGALPEALDLAVATHLAFCDICRADAAAHEALGGALLDAAPEGGLSRPAEGSLARTLARAHAMPAEPEQAPRPSPDALPQPLSDWIGPNFSDIRWRRIGGGVAQAPIRTRSGGSAYLLRIPGGVAVPDHGHRGTELTLVLSGAFSDKVSRFGPGDIEVADPALEHTPTAEPGPPCICLAATDARLRFNSFLPRVAQRLFGI
ncbi:ChrR family anti-sigma-E factor [Pseudoroseicyclus aestuarii]|uniref:ChrR-like anti-ECFsigma factor n=1 Tax=Pseudoroseicyclus aestuarii TaxID=1795041 RepID=A0A318SSW1_9RHOB|nr:ChrR family anti-sigma-E factor [Pseudoroseicyclus aestuarii]PYE84920.1 ChrR-like anti-ECFsigma factor [Pseudoroseicyclus aestuarii]